MGAKTYTEYTLAAPTGVTAVKSAGGALVNGTTYYYKVLALSVEGGGAISQGYINCESVLSSEVSDTCDATNKSIVISWNAVTNADYYVVLRTLTMGDYSYGTAKMLTATALVVSVTAPTVTFTDNGARSAYNFRVYTNGLPAIKLEGGSAVDYIDEAWIYTQMSGGTLGAFVSRVSDQSGTYPIAYFFDCSFLMGISSSNPTFLRFNRAKIIVHNGRFHVVSGLYMTYDMGTTLGSFGYGGPTYLKLGKTYSSAGDSIFMGKGNIYGTRVIDWLLESGTTLVPEASNAYFGYRNSVGQLNNYDYTTLLTLKNCMMSGAPQGCIKAGYISLLNNLFLMALYFVGQPDNLTLSGGYVAIPEGDYMYTYASGFFKAEDVTFSYSDYDLVFGGSTNYRVFLLRNCTCYNTPFKAMTGSNNDYTRWYDGVTFDLTVVDNAGAALSGATVAIEDINGYNSAWQYSNCDLNEDLSTGEVSSISVTDASQLSANDVIMIDMEKMTVSSVNTGSNEITVTRNAFEDTFQPNSRFHDGASTLAVQPKIYKRVATLTTDAEGEIEQQLWILKDRYDYNAGGVAPYKYTKTTYNPYKITISKSGYETLVLNNVSFSTKAQWRVELQSAMKMDLDGNLFMSSDADSPMLPL